MHLFLRLLQFPQNLLNAKLLTSCIWLVVLSWSIWIVACDLRKRSILINLFTPFTLDNKSSQEHSLWTLFPCVKKIKLQIELKISNTINIYSPFNVRYILFYLTWPLSCIVDVAIKLTSYQMNMECSLSIFHVCLMWCSIRAQWIHIYCENLSFFDSNENQRQSIRKLSTFARILNCTWSNRNKSQPSTLRFRRHRHHRFTYKILHFSVLNTNVYAYVCTINNVETLFM